MFLARTGRPLERLPIDQAQPLADSFPPRCTVDVEAEYCAHLEQLERLEVRPALADAGLL